MRSRLSLALLAAFVAGCDNWPKMKDCAAAANSFLEAGNKSEVLGFVNHYNTRANRCYVQLTRRSGGADRSLYYELFDAFEGKLIASCADDAVLFCHVEGDPKHAGDCPFCRSFTQQLMNN